MKAIRRWKSSSWEASREDSEARQDLQAGSLLLTPSTSLLLFDTIFKQQVLLQNTSAHNLILWSWKIFEVEKTAPHLSESTLTLFHSSPQTWKLLLHRPLVPEATRQARHCFLIYTTHRNPKVGLKYSCVWLSEGMCVVKSEPEGNHQGVETHFPLTSCHFLSAADLVSPICKLGLMNF